MPNILDALQPHCCCVRRNPVYPEVLLMESASALSLSTLIMVVASSYHFDRITIISALFSVYFYKMVANNYREVQLKYYDTLEREEIETDGDRSRDSIKEATNVVENEDDDDEDYDDEDDDDEDYDDMPPLIPHKQLSQDDYVLEQLHAVERETRQRNAERAMAAVISHLDAADEILGENRLHLD
jgi:nitrate reductase cytochrome c-type subunit